MGKHKHLGNSIYNILALNNLKQYLHNLINYMTFFMKTRAASVHGANEILMYTVSGKVSIKLKGDIHTTMKPTTIPAYLSYFRLYLARTN